MESRPWRKVLRGEEFIVTALFFLGILGLAITTLGWPNKPRMLPLAILLIALLLLAVRIVDILLKGKVEAAHKLPWRVVGSFLALGAVIPLTYAFGLAPAVGVLGVSLSIIYGERRWWVVILIGLSSALIIYFMYGKFFGIPMKF